MSVLSGGSAPLPGAAPAAAPAPAAPGPFGSIPEKFQVKATDGTPDLAASWAKVEEHRSHLEKRLGAGDIPPKTAEEYKVNLPLALAEKVKVDELAASPAFKDMLTKAHAAGLTQKQVDFVVGDFMERSLALQSGMVHVSADECVAALKSNWKTDDEFKQNVRAAYRSATAYGDVNQLMAKYGNDPDFIRFAANVGKELAEGTSAPQSGAMPQQDVDALQKSKAYWDANDPAHTATVAKVQKHYESVHGTKPKQTGATTFSTGV